MTTCLVAVLLGVLIGAVCTASDRQISGQLPAGPAGGIAWPDRGQQRSGLGSGQEPRRASGDQLQQQPVQSADGTGSGAGEFVPAVG